MQKFFGSRSQAIQLSSDDEDDFGGGSSDFGCVSCLPRFSMMGGNGTIRIAEEDATLDDYLDPNTTTTIEPLLEEYNSQQTDNAFNGATLQDSQQFLTRNPFASSIAKPTTTTTNNDIPTQHTFETNNSNDDNQHDSYQEHQHSFAGALPRVDFFLESDENDAEFLSDHRISAVIGDSSKLTSQFELFKAQDKIEQLLPDDNSHSNGLEIQSENGEQGNNIITTDLEPPQPFEIQNDWTEETLDVDSEMNVIQQHELGTDCNQLQQNIQVDTTVSIPIHTPDHNTMITNEVNSMSTSPPINNNDQTADNTAEDQKLPVNELHENTNTSRGADDNNIYTSTHHSASLNDEDNASNTDMNQPSLSTPPVTTSTNHPTYTSNNSQSTDMKQDGTEQSKQNPTVLRTYQSAPSISSSPPSPTPTISTENASSSFPSTQLPFAQNLDDSPANEVFYQHQHIKDDDETSNISASNDPDIKKGDTTICSSSDTGNGSQLSVRPSTADETKINTNSTLDGKRRSSVAAVAHSLLGDKLDDFTEKLAYIRKNIMMSLEDDDQDNDDYYSEDMTKFGQQQQQQQQLRRSRSGSMQQDMRRQSFDPFISRSSGNAQQHSRRHLTRTDTVDAPRTHHRRSNSLMDGASSFAKIFQQMGGQHNGDQRHFSPSSFFGSLAGPDIPSSSPSTTSLPSGSANETATASPVPQRSSSMSSPGQRDNQYPVVSRSATQLNSGQQLPSSEFYNNEPFLQHVNEEENLEEEDLFDFSKMIAMGKNVRSMSEDLMGNGIRLFSDLSTRMRNANATRMTAMEQHPSSNIMNAQEQHQQQQQQGQYLRQPQPQPQPQEEHQTSSLDQDFLLSDTYI